MEKYLTVLGLNPNTRYTPDEIKKAWKALCKTHHPDAGGSDEKFREITHAYNMLTDPSYRYENDKKEDLKKMDLNIRMQVPVSFEQAFFGCDFSINYNREVMDDNGNVVPQEHYEIESLRIKIPAGSCLGVTRQFKGKGIKSGDNVGDVELHVVVNRHPKFQVDEHSNVIAQESIPLDLLIKGGKHEVQTMYGLKTVKIAPGTRPGTRLRIKNCGQRNEGDHVIICNPLFPTPEELKKDAWKGLDINWKLDEEVRAEEEEDAKLQRRFRAGGFTFTTSGGL